MLRSQMPVRLLAPGRADRIPAPGSEGSASRWWSAAAAPMRYSSASATAGDGDASRRGWWSTPPSPPAPGSRIATPAPSPGRRRPDASRRWRHFVVDQRIAVERHRVQRRHRRRDADVAQLVGGRVGDRDRRRVVGGHPEHQRQRHAVLGDAPAVVPWRVRPASQVRVFPPARPGSGGREKRQRRLRRHRGRRGRLVAGVARRRIWAWARVTALSSPAPTAASRSTSSSPKIVLRMGPVSANRAPSVILHEPRVTMRAVSTSARGKLGETPPRRHATGDLGVAVADRIGKLRQSLPAGGAAPSSYSGSAAPTPVVAGQQDLVTLRVDVFDMEPAMRMAAHEPV